ncbi:MAG: type II toxin-antitoxin system CcdA family antitoxin [Pseudonocardia sp.]
MNKRRITLNLDDDVVAALRAVGGASMSAVANDALREALERKAHQAAVLHWLDDLYREHGAPTDEDYAEADALLDSLQHTGRGESGAA